MHLSRSNRVARSLSSGGATTDATAAAGVPAVPAAHHGVSAGIRRQQKRLPRLTGHAAPSVCLQLVRGCCALNVHVSRFFCRYELEISFSSPSAGQEWPIYLLVTNFTLFISTADSSYTASPVSYMTYYTTDGDFIGELTDRAMTAGWLGLVVSSIFAVHLYTKGKLYKRAKVKVDEASPSHSAGSQPAPCAVAATGMPVAVPQQVPFGTLPTALPTALPTTVPTAVPTAVPAALPTAVATTVPFAAAVACSATS